MSGDPQLPEPGGGFRSSGTPGGRWGCLIAAAIFVCCLPLILILTWEFPSTGDWFLHAWLPALLAAVVVGIAVRVLVNLEWRRRANAETRTHFWFIAAVIATAGAAIVLIISVF